MDTVARAIPKQNKRGTASGAGASTKRNANIVAIDLGAESCRVSLAAKLEDRVTLKTVYRFPNAPVQVENHLYWDLATIRQGVLDGILKCAELANGPIDAIGVDGWAVD